MSDKEIINIRKKIYYMFKKNYLTESDIRKICNYDFCDIEILFREGKINKELYSIYINPYLLCIDYMFMEGILYVDFNTIADLLIKRYNMEIEELNYQKRDEDNYNKLKYLYFENSIVGRRIYHMYINDIKDLSNIKKI